MQFGKLIAIGLICSGLGFSAKAEDPVRRLETILTIDDNMPSVRDYVAEQTFFGAELSPDGNYVAGVRRDGLEYYVVVTDLRDETLAFTGTRFEDLLISDIHWATNDRIVVEAFAFFSPVSRSLMTKAEWSDPANRRIRVNAVYGINRDGTNVMRFFEGDSTMDNLFTDVQLVDVAMGDADNMLVQLRVPERANAKDERSELGGADLYKVDINTGETNLFVRGKRRTTNYETDAQGNLKYRIDVNSIETRNVYYIADFNDKGKIEWTKGASIERSTIVDELDKPFKFSILSPAEEAPFFYVRDLVDGEDRHAIYLYNLATGEHVEKIAAHPTFDMGGGGISQVGGAVFEPHTNELIGVSWAGEKPEMLLFDPNQQNHVDALKAHFGDQLNFGLAGMSQDGRRWLLRVQGPGHPGYYATYDLETVKVREIAVRSAALDGKAVYETKIVRYKARDGQDLYGYLTLPFGGLSNQSYPFVMYPHGGPQARDFFRWDGTVQLLASRGYAVFQPQFRGSAGQGKRFAQSGYREWGGLMQTDVEDGMAYLVQKNIIDAERGCIMGFSYGAYAAMEGAVKTPTAFRCVLAGGGVYDLRAMQKWSKSVRGKNSSSFKYWTTQLGDPVGNYDDLVARSPARNIDKLLAPVFLFHGSRDNTVPIEQAEILKAQLSSAGHPFEYVVMKKAGHEFGRGRTREPQEIREAILLFLATHNPTDRNRLK